MEHGSGERERKTEVDIAIIYEDTDILVIDKPAGLMVHADGFSETPTVVDWFLAAYPEAKDVGEPQRLQNGKVISRPGIVHRLDRETSGVMILAKTQEAFTHLKQQFQNRTIKKEYRAFVYGRMREQMGIIDRKIGRAAHDPRKRSAERGAKGILREAVTEWKVICEDDAHAFLAVFPRTGRTHQIRVHLKSIGRPIVGDTLYAPAHMLQGENLGIRRLALHAYALTLQLPTGEMRTCTAELPQAFEAAAKRMSAGDERKD